MTRQGRPMSSLPGFPLDPLTLRRRCFDALATTLALLIVGLLLRLVSTDDLPLPLLASMGASAFLLFVVSHSPMAQPWPLVGGNCVAALSALMFALLIDDPIVIAACSVGATILVMHGLRCLHPPAAATAVAIASGTIPFDDQVYLTVGAAVGGSTLILLLLALIFNNLIPGRHYPQRDHHHPHHQAFQQAHIRDPLRLDDDDIEWALGQMDGILDVSRKDLIDIYELALDHAIARRAGTATGKSADSGPKNRV